MASTSGTKGPPLGNEEDVVDSEIVPSSLAVLVPILRAALEIEEENPTVAYLCRFHAFEKACTMDPTSRGHSVCQFKTYLLHKLEKERELKEELVKRSDARELQTYYQQFYEKKIREGKFIRRPEEMIKNVQIATVLYEVLKTMVAPQSIEERTKRFADDVENERGQYEPYNILPLYAIGVKSAIMELPEIRAAIAALCRVDNLPIPIIRARPDASTMPSKRLKNMNDILDWIASVFGFREIHRIKLPGPPTIGEGKPENQNHAIIFTRGEALQPRDMNQDNYYEESFKMRNVLQQFRRVYSGQRKPTILGIREHFFTARSAL